MPFYSSVCSCGIKWHTQRGATQPYLNVKTGDVRFCIVLPLKKADWIPLVVLHSAGLSAQTRGKAV